MDTTQSIVKMLRFSLGDSPAPSRLQMAAIPYSVLSTPERGEGSALSSGGGSKPTWRTPAMASSNCIFYLYARFQHMNLGEGGQTLSI